MGLTLLVALQAWQVPVASQQMQGFLSHLANSGLRDYAHPGKPSPPNVMYVLAIYPGNTPASWRRQLYMDLGNGVKAVNLWPVTLNGATSPGCAVDYRAYGGYPVGAMHMEVRKSVLELSKFDDIIWEGLRVSAASVCFC